MAKKEEALISLNGLSVEELLEEVQSRGYYVARTPLARRGQTFKGDLKRWRGPKHRFGVVSDTHFGSRYQQLSHLSSFYSLCARRKIHTIFHCGDLTDGNGKMHRDQVYEMFIHGADRIRDYTIDMYPRRKRITTYFIGGNHDSSFHRSDGYNICEAIAAQRADMVYLGNDVAYYDIGKLKIGVFHGSGGTAYATSYKSQKLVEKLPGGEKPHLLFLGHYHHPNIIPGYRNVETVQMPCFQATTPYMLAKALRAFVAGFIVTVQEDETGLGKVIYELIPFHNTRKDDF